MKPGDPSNATKKNYRKRHRTIYVTEGMHFLAILARLKSKIISELCLCGGAKQHHLELNPRHLDSSSTTKCK